MTPVHKIAVIVVVDNVNMTIDSWVSRGDPTAEAASIGKGFARIVILAGTASRNANLRDYEEGSIGSG
jgi:hypothetical protein